MHRSRLAVIVDQFFDGERLHRGPHTVRVRDGVLMDVARGDREADLAARGWAIDRGALLLPGLVDAHAHLFLDAASTDPLHRAEHLKRPLPQLVAAARTHAREAIGWGVTLVRDAGDRYGVNNRIREEAARPGSGLPRVRSAGSGMKRAHRYGAFMAGDIDDSVGLESHVRELARQGDEIKLVLSGMLDCQTGTVRDDPQFTLAEARRIVDAAHDCGRKVMAHCIGAIGLAVAIDAGADSVEHGLFMDRETLARMRDRDVAWTPTFCPLHFQWAHPKTARWSSVAVGNMRTMLDGHSGQLLAAHEMGVRLLVGTDAGCMGVQHGRAVYEEMWHFLDAGLPLDAVLRAATAAPRRHFGEPHPLLVCGAPFEAVLFQQPPFEGRAVQRPRRVWSPALADEEAFAP